MKTKIYIQILLVFSLISCSDDFLVKDPQGVITEENYFQSHEDALRALTSVYSPIHYDHVGFQTIFMGDVLSDNAEKGGENFNFNPEFRDMTWYNWRADMLIIERLYDYQARGIYWANWFLENVENMEIDIDLPAGYSLKDRMMAEAKFLRAYYYFELLKNFGGVPLITEVLNPDEAFLSRSSEMDVWSQIEIDLNEAIEHLPLKTEYADADIGRATKGAAQALLVKAYIFQASNAKFNSDYRDFNGELAYAATNAEEKYQQAKELAETIINSGIYSLTPHYKDILTIESENNEESVFEIQFEPTQNNDLWLNNSGGNTFNRWMRSRGAESPGWGWCIPTQDLWDAYEPFDPRRDWTIVHEGEVLPENDSLPVVNVTKDVTEGATGYTNQKYFLSVPEMEPAFQNWSDGPSNNRIIRFAHVLLWHAEAANEIGMPEDALISLERVRERARNSLSGSDTIPAEGVEVLPEITTTNQEELRQIIRKENRVEFAMENHRFYDLKRWGIVPTVINNFYIDNPVHAIEEPFVKGKHEFIPLPQSMIDMYLAEGVPIRQNPGF